MNKDISNLKTVVFRVDASIDSGIGHVMRCLAIAKKLCRYNLKACFICKDHDGNMIEFIQANGFVVFPLECTQITTTPEHGIYDAWLGGDVLSDATLTKNILDDLNVALLVVDHYAIDSRWEQVFAESFRVVVIDDLANRQHHCDVLIDQTFGRKKEDYTRLVNGSTLLLGPKFALLRDEFELYREISLSQKLVVSFPSRLFICFGGVDKGNQTLIALELLAGCTFPKDTIIDIVVGNNYPHLDTLKLKIASLPWDINLLVGASNVAEIMTRCHWSIGSSGGVSWERAALGLPSIVFVVAENQLAVAKGLQEVGAISLVTQKPYTSVELQSGIDHIFSSFHSNVIVNSVLCDGKGVVRVLDTLLNGITEHSRVCLKDAELVDCKILYDWQCEPSVRRFAKHSGIPSWREHVEWFDSKLACTASIIKLIYAGGLAVGVVRLDPADDLKTQVISIYLGSEFHGNGYAADALMLIREAMPLIDILAIVLPENLASQKLFKKSGFSQVSKTEWLSSALEK